MGSIPVATKVSSCFIKGGGGGQCVGWPFLARWLQKRFCDFLYLYIKNAAQVNKINQHAAYIASVSKWSSILLYVARLSLKGLLFVLKISFIALDLLSLNNIEIN